MEKKNYQKPDMHVVKLRYHSHLLEGSPDPANNNDSRSYRMNDDE